MRNKKMSNRLNQIHDYLFVWGKRVKLQIYFLEPHLRCQLSPQRQTRVRCRHKINGLVTAKVIKPLYAVKDEMII